MSNGSGHIQDSRDAAADLPETAPLAMPAQNLRFWGRSGPLSRRAKPVMIFRRSLLFVGSAILCACALAANLGDFLRNGVTPIELAALCLFTPLLLGLSFWFVNALIGFVILMTRQQDMLGMNLKAPPPTPSTRTAILMPIYNEDAAAVCDRLLSVAKSLDAGGLQACFDIFLLSDTTDAGIAAQEEMAFAQLKAQSPVQCFYRRRRNNHERKPGNIADWVRRFGGAYEQAAILDADSIMSGDALAHLVGVMERRSEIGLLQTLPTIVKRRTLFGRYLQFGVGVYSPVAWAGLSFWNGEEGLYWGHNALFRTRAFAAHAGLPQSGDTQREGRILSHDAVEAILMRRAGYSVRMAPAMPGSYEECPPTLVEFMDRDRRWCQGNLQNLRFFTAPGLHWIQRAQLVLNCMLYVASPMFVGYLVLRVVGGIGNWHADMDWSSPDFLIKVVSAPLLMATMLLGPKIFGCLYILSRKEMREKFGGAAALIGGAITEILVAALIGPAMMVSQTAAVLSIMIGRDNGWTTQRRDADSLPAKEAAAYFGWQSALGIGLTAGLIHSLDRLSPSAPILGGMIAAAPVAMLTARGDFGLWLRDQKLLLTPEECAPPPVLNDNNGA
ncbi:MAG: glucans biosynthesis glucosyltransferase MdoH [Caulobacterales bacterium]